MENEEFKPVEVGPDGPILWTTTSDIVVTPPDYAIPAIGSEKLIALAKDLLRRLQEVDASILSTSWPDSFFTLIINSKEYFISDTRLEESEFTISGELITQMELECGTFPEVVVRYANGSGFTLPNATITLSETEGVYNLSASKTRKIYPVIEAINSDKLTRSSTYYNISNDEVDFKDAE